jgi:hypothetical protein
VDQEGISFFEAIQHVRSYSVTIQFNKFIYENFVLKNLSFQIVTFGDWPLKYQIPIEAKQKEIKLGPHFS